MLCVFIIYKRYEMYFRDVFRFADESENSNKKSPGEANGAPPSRQRALVSSQILMFLPLQPQKKKITTGQNKLLLIEPVSVRNFDYIDGWLSHWLNFIHK